MFIFTTCLCHATQKSGGGTWISICTMAGLWSIQWTGRTLVLFKAQN